MRILVVDDDKTVREFFMRALAPPEYQVVAVASGSEAIEEARSSPFYLAFVDVIMPGGMDGLETLKALLRERPQLPVIMMTGYAVEDNVILALHFGAIDVIYKPFDDPQLILAAIQQFQKRQQLKPLGETEG